MNVRKQAQALKQQMKSGEGVYKPKTFEELNAEVEAMARETTNSVPKFQRREVQPTVYTPAAQNTNLPQNNQNGGMTFSDALGTVKTELNKNNSIEARDKRVRRQYKARTTKQPTKLDNGKTVSLSFNEMAKIEAEARKNINGQKSDYVPKNNDEKTYAEYLTEKANEAAKNFIGPIQQTAVTLDSGETIRSVPAKRIDEIKKQAEKDIETGVRRFKTISSDEQKLYNYFNPLPSAKIGANRPQTKEEKAIYAKEQEKRIQSIDPAEFEQSVKNKFILEHTRQPVTFGDTTINISPLRLKEIAADAKKYKGTDITDLKLSRDEQAYRNYISTGIMERAIREQRNKEYEQASPIKEFGMRASDTFSNAGINMYSGMARVASNFYNALGLFGIAGENAFTRTADGQDKAIEYANFRSRSLKDNPDSVLNQIVDSTFQSVPRMALDGFLAMMTGGATSASTAATEALEAIAPNATTTGGYVISSLVNKIGQAIKLPKYMIPMFADQAISSYRDALSDGKPQWQAITFGLTNGYLNALLEGGGIEESFANTAKNRLQQRILSDSDDVLKKAFKTTANKLSPALKEWASSTVEEGLEEVTQSITEKALRNILLQEDYGKFYKTGFDNSEDNAFINLREELVNFAGGALGGAAFGGINLASSIVNNQVVNSANKRTAIKNIDREINNTQKYISELENYAKTDVKNKSGYTVQIKAANDYISDLNRYKSNIKSKNPTAEANLATGTQYESISEFNPNYYDSQAKQYVRADKNENGTYTVKYFNGSYITKTSGKMYQRYISVENNAFLRDNLNTLINEEKRFSAKENTASENNTSNTDNAEVMYSVSFSENGAKNAGNAILNIVKNNIDKISSNTVFDVSGNVDISAYRKKSDYILDIFNKQGKIAHNSVIGDVELNRSGAKSTVIHGFGNIKFATVGAIKNTIENGAIINHEKNYNGSGVDRYIIAAKGKIGGEDAVIGVVVKSYPNGNASNKFYLHEAAIIRRLHPPTAPQSSVDTVGETASGKTVNVNPDNSISQNGGDVNGNFAQNTENNSETVKNGSEKRHFNADYAKSSVREFGQILGINVEFSDNLGKNVDGMYYTKDGQPTIVIANETTDPVMTVFKHELTHSFQTTDPKAYAEYKKYVIDKLQAYNPEIYKEHFNSLWERYCKQYNADTKNGRFIKTVKNENGTVNYVTDENGMFVYDGEKRVTAADIEDEIAARATESFLTDTKGIAFQKMADKNPNAAKGFINALRSMILRLVQFSQQLKKRFAGAFNTKAETEMLRADINAFREAEKMFTDMLEGRYNANPNNAWDPYIDRSASANTEIENNRPKQLFKDYSAVTESILNVSDKAAKEYADNRIAVEVSAHTPDVILNNVEGAKDLRIIMNYAKLYLAIRKDGVFKGHYHNLGAKTAKRLPDILANPDAIIQLGNGRLNIFSTIKTDKGNNGIISVELNSTKDIEGKYQDYNVVVTMFSSDNNYVKNLLSGENVDVKYKKEDLSQVNPQLYTWLAIINDKSSADNSISQNDTFVNSSIRNNSVNDTTANFDSEKIESVVDDIIDYSAKFAGVDNTKVQRIVNAVTSLSNTDLYSGIEISADMKQSVKDNINTLRDSLKNGNLTVKVADGIKYIADIAENALNNKERFSISDSFANDFKDWINRGKPDRETLTIGKTSAALKSIGVKNQTITWDTSKINKSLKKHLNIDVNVIKQIPNVLEHPILVMQSKQSDSRITLLGEVYDKNGIPVIGVLELMPTNRAQTVVLDEIKIASTYSKTKENNVTDITPTQKFIDSSDILYVEPNKKRTDNWLIANRLQLPLAIINYGSVKSITYPQRNVNTNYMQKSGNYSVQTDEKPKFSLAGEKAITADIKTLDMAKELDEKGVPNEEIYHQTSWFKGADGKWRFEISDKDMELSKAPAYKTHNDGDSDYYTMKLSDVLTHKKLFEAYPEFKDYTLIIQDTDTGVQGINFYKYKQIVLSKELFKRFTKEYQNFLNGGRKSRIAEIEQTPEYKEYQKFYDMADDEISDIQKWLDEEEIARDKFFNSDLGKEYYQLNWGKPNIKKFELGFTEQAKSVIAHEIQHSIQEIEGFATGSSPEYWKQNPRFKDESKIREYEMKLKEVENKFKKIWSDDINLNLAKEYCNMEDVLSDKAVAIENLAEKGGWYNLLSDYAEANTKLKFEKNRSMKNPELLYQNTAGEIEARDVEHRIELSDEERRNTFPESAKENPDRVFADKTIAEDKNVKFSLADNADVTHSQNFKDWFGDWENNPETASKIVNEDGTPKVMYHGSKNNFFEFKKGSLNGWLGKGIYFASDKKVAKQFGRKIYSAYLDLKNPFIVKGNSYFDALTEIKAQYPQTDENNMAEILKESGYDGIIFNDWDKGEIISVFEPNQIKSATDNIGTFDKSNPDIRYSLADDSDTSGIFSPNKTEAQRYSAQVDEWLGGKMKSSDLFKLGRTPVVLRELGARDLPIVMSQDVMVKVTGGKHSIALDELKQLPKAIADPIIAFKSATVNNAYVILTELTDKYGNDVVVAMHLGRTEKHIKINRIASIYGKENIGNFVKEQIKVGNLKYIDKNKSLSWSQSRGLQLPKLADTVKDFNNSILQREDIVNRYSAQNTNKNTGNMNKTDPNKHIIDKIVSGKEPKLSLKEEKAYKRLEDTNKLLREHFKLTPGEKVTEEHALKLAKKYVKQYGLVYDTADYANKIKEVINHEAENVKNKNSEHNIFEELQAVNAEMLENAKALDTTISDQYKDLAATLKKGVQITDEMKSSITDYKDFKASVRNSLTLKKDSGADVDKLYQELTEQYPEFFGNDIINPVDRLFKLAEVSQAIKPQIVTPEYGTASINDIANIVTAEMLDELTPQTRMGKRVNELKYKLGETKRAMRAQAAYSKYVAVQKANARGAAKLEKAKQAMEAQKTHLKRESDLRVAFAVDKEAAKLEKYKAERKNKAARDYLFKALDKLSKMDTQSINNEKFDSARKSISNEIIRINEAIEKDTEKLNGNLTEDERMKTQQHLTWLKNTLAKKSATLKNLSNMKENGVDFETQKAELMRNIAAVAQSNIDSAVAEINNLIAEQNKKIAELKEKLGGDLPQNVLEQTGKKIKALESKRDKLLQQASKKQSEGGDNINVYKALKESDIDTLTDFAKDVLNLQNDIRTYGKALKNAKTADLYLIADKIAREQEDYAKLRNGKNGNKKNTFAESLKIRTMFDVLSPMRVARMVSGYNENSELMRIFNDINAGQEDVRKFKYQANKMFEDAFKNANISLIDTINKLSGKKADTVRFKADGKEYEITKGMRISLYLHSLNESNMFHIEHGGIIIPNVKEFKKGNPKAFDEGEHSEPIKLTAEDVRSIISGMSKEEKLYAQVAHKFFNEKAKNAINARSEYLVGYDIADVTNYFPIVTERTISDVMLDNNPLLSSMYMNSKGEYKEDKSGIASIEGRGEYKHRIKGSSNPIILEDVYSVVKRHIKNTAQYYGMSMPLRNLTEVLNTFTFSDGRFKTVAAVLEKNWGSGFTKWLTNLRKDLNFGRRIEDDTVIGKVLGKTSGKYAGAVLTGNLSVILKQTASYPTAIAELGPEAIARGFADMSKMTDDFINSLTGIYAARGNGVSDVSFEDVLNENPLVQKSPTILRAFAKGIETADKITVKKLFKAAMWSVKLSDSQYKNMDMKTAMQNDDFKAKVVDAYIRTVENTQPMYDTMQRNALQRSPNGIVRASLPFMTQRFQNLGIMLDTIGNYKAKRLEYKTNKNSTTEANLKEARKRFVWAIQSRLIANVMMTGINALWKLLRDRTSEWKDDDGKTDKSKVMAWSVDDFFKNNIGDIPYGGTLYSVITTTGKHIANDFLDKIDSGFKFDVENQFNSSTDKLELQNVEVLNDLISLPIYILANSQKKTIPDIASNVSTYVSRFVGFPADSVKNIYLVTLNTIRQGMKRLGMDTTEYDFRAKSLEWKVNEKNASKFYEYSNRAFLNYLKSGKKSDLKIYNDISDELVKGGIPKDKIENKAYKYAFGENEVLQNVVAGDKYFNRLLKQVEVSVLPEYADTDTENKATSGLVKKFTELQYKDFEKSFNAELKNIAKDKGTFNAAKEKWEGSGRAMIESYIAAELKNRLKQHYGYADKEGNKNDEAIQADFDKYVSLKKSGKYKEAKSIEKHLNACGYAAELKKYLRNSK